MKWQDMTLGSLIIGTVWIEITSSSVSEITTTPELDVFFSSPCVFFTVFSSVSSSCALEMLTTGKLLLHQYQK